ncbi:ABC-type lipoprotein export system, ATPase component [Desulfuromusa kysingii]|uniref:ABC-type lipoprotein export system, ATPase component n=1 Tax=Desulfuromusa kysingii TaxID=37625 RepID=A0A1H3ZDN7_9BACT|nr:ATP-binding cassette domain-containing protein [Desulfuromusa kysingii]SEA21780.1 ABC-type lipoprotein export system, ATPase component [Desulfuromusa kysingii]
MKATTLLSQPLTETLVEHPYIEDFMTSFGLVIKPDSNSLQHYLDHLDPDALEDLGISSEQLRQSLDSFLAGMLALSDPMDKVESLTIVGGVDKSGKAENLQLTLKPGEVICIVGPTGSGKSRLLADIEWVAQGDTPTKRKILINDQVPDSKWRFSTEHKLVAQLSQNMNFVMDLSAEEFIRMHAESRLVTDPEAKVAQILLQANELAGETFAPDTPVTSLSGGQSRALMIADMAILSKSPIALIDEIENAGIDRKKALELLVQEEKIILMATHDPILALMGDRRVVIKNGGIEKIIESSEAERKNLVTLEALDNKLLALRNRIRTGDTLENL